MRIDGDYANLRRTDIESNDLKLVACALLSAGINEGSKLKYELFQCFTKLFYNLDNEELIKSLEEY